MIYTYINGIDRTQDIKWNSIKIVNQLQERTNTASFVIFNGDRPDDYNEVLMYHGTEIVTVGADYVTVKDVYEYKDVFRVGDTIYVGINTSDEAQYIIQSVEGNKITFTTTLSGISAGERIGHRIFGGVVLSDSDKNLHSLDNLIFNVRCVDYTKLFDMNQVINVYKNKTPRYIINDICNNFVNYNEAIDTCNYATNGDIQAVWSDSGVANPATTNTTTPQEGTAWASFASSASGDATWTADPIASARLNAFTKVSSGTPIDGYLRFWIEHTDYTKINNYTFRLGSSSSDYAEITATPIELGVTDDSPTFVEIALSDFSITGVPNWNDSDYALFSFNCTASTTVKISSLRVMEEVYFNHADYVEEGNSLASTIINYEKPMAVLQRLAKDTAYFWYIDEQKKIHFFSQTTNVAPYNVSNNSDNFYNLSVEYDASKLKNVQYVQGGEDVSVSDYGEPKKGDDARREWLLNTKFADLQAHVDDETTTHVAEAGTTTTNITITGHGLDTGDYITNRTRNNAVRTVSKVDNDNVTIGAITSQAAGDTISYFDQERTSGIEGIDDESAVDYVYNSNARKVRASEQTNTLKEGEIILFRYKERFSIISAAQNGTSIAAIRSKLGWSSGEVMGKLISDRKIRTQETAKQVAQAEVNRYGNVILSASFETYVSGLKSGQLIKVTDTTSGRNIDQHFIIQKVVYKIDSGNHIKYQIQACSILYGIIEFFQQLLMASRNVEYNEGAVPINLVQGNETLTISDTFEEKDKNTQIETITISDSVSRAEVRTPPYKWATSVNNLEWSLGEWA